jgi:CspA family cold shock protein
VIKCTVLRLEDALVMKTKGTVRAFDGSRGYGYIQTEKGLEVFVHFSSIQGDMLKTLAAGDRVEFVLEEGYRGPQAQQVVRLN